MARYPKDANKSFDYVKDYIRESVTERDSLKAIIERVVKAYKKEPSRNTYKENAYKYYQGYANDPTNDRMTCNYMKAACDSIPMATNPTIFNAVETVVSMATGGIGQFEYKPADEYLSKDPELADMQAAFLKYMYEKNHIDGMAPATIRKGVMQGQFNWMIKPCPKKDGDIDFKVSLIDAYKMIEDPRASKTNRSRYIGYQEIASWSQLKDSMKLIERDGDYYVEVVNDVDIYLNELHNWGDESSATDRWTTELSNDLNTFSSIYNIAFAKGSSSVDRQGNPLKDIKTVGYKGDDVEVSYLWDLMNDMYFVVVNRRFIIYKKDHPLQKTIKMKIPYKDPDSGELKAKEMDYTVKVDSPIVHRGYIDADWETYPISPVFYCLDDFDNVCSKESVMEHDMSIMAPITFLSTSYDAEKVSGLSQIAGQIVEGSQNTIQVMNKTYDLSAITASVQRTEDRIKRMMGATDQFELMALLNNRATGAEVSMANGAVSQRMNVMLPRLEDGYSELMSKLLSMMIIYSDEDTFTFPYKDGVMALNRSDLVGNSLIRVKLASRIKIEQQEQSQNALMVLQTLAPLAQQGINVQRVIMATVPVITQGVINRRTAESFIDDSLKLNPAQLNAAIKETNDERKRQQAEGPLTEDDMASMSPDNMAELEQMYNQAVGGQALDQGLPTDQSQSPMTNAMALTDNTAAPYGDQNDMVAGGGMAQSDQSVAPAGQGSGEDVAAMQASQLPTGADQMTPIPEGMTPDMAGQVANTDQRQQ